MESSSVTYPGKHFEVREHDAPTKYVWNGETRVARVTGSLSPVPRVQRLRIWPGWNLCSLAVTAPLSVPGGEGDVVRSAFKWDPATKDWLPVTPNQGLPAGTVLWLRSTFNVTLRFAGPYSDPMTQTVTSNGEFLPGAGLEVWDVQAATSHITTFSTWIYDASVAHWLATLPLPFESQSHRLAFVNPGCALFAGSETATQVATPDASCRIHFYHGDHLSSSAIVSTGSGSISEELEFYPFGAARSGKLESAVRSGEAYRFAEKEQDTETSLGYLEARYASFVAARFLGVDPLYSRVCRLPKDKLLGSLEKPASLNLYAYVWNNPLRHVDPMGTDPKDAVASAVVVKILEDKKNAGIKFSIPAQSGRVTVLPQGLQLVADAIKSGHIKVVSVDPSKMQPGAAAEYDYSTKTMRIGSLNVKDAVARSYVVHEAVHALLGLLSHKKLERGDNEAASYIAQNMYLKLQGDPHAFVGGIYGAAQAHATFLFDPKMNAGNRGAEMVHRIQVLRAAIKAESIYSRVFELKEDFPK